MKLQRLSAFTLIELLVVISIIGILASLALPAITGAMARGQMTQTLSNCKQLHLATQQMALDGTTTGDASLTWPGSMSNSSWTAWANALVPSYLGTNDFNKLLSAAGLTRPITTDIGTATPSALNVYNVSEQSSGDSVFIATANYTFNTVLDPAGKPYGDKGFVVFHKAGDGQIFLRQQATNMALVGNTTNLTKLQ